ncbi:hypothetical protein FRC03_006478 [Tulasnella sp. 419]|nr:hypothetical protein FRC03_006478 [Tulasnella sp. 419]
MKFTLLSAALFSLVAVNVNAQSFPKLWKQCGGMYWNGMTDCGPCLVCHYHNQFFSECYPGPDFGSCVYSTTSTPTPTP